MVSDNDEALKEAEEITLRVASNELVAPEELVEQSKALDESPVGTKLDNRYRIDTLMGSGATSSVYHGFDLQRNREVAVKIMHRHLVSDGLAVRRFEQEAETAQIVNHPNIVDIYDLKRTESGQPYLVMEFVRGRSLQDNMSDSGGSLEWRRAIDIALQVSAALRAAHEKGVVHRDLKPANIMIATDANGRDFVKVLDFGIAKVTQAEGDTFFKATQAGEMLGSLLYMSPEQCNGEHIDARSDVYSLGCVLYEIVTGTAPVSGRTAFETMNKHISTMPERLNRVRPNLEFPDGLERVIFKAVSKKPTDRFQTIGEFQDDLVALRDGRSVNASPVNMPSSGIGIAGASDTATGAADPNAYEFKGTAKFVIDLIGLFFLYMVFLVVFAFVALFAGSMGGVLNDPVNAVLFAFLVTTPLPAYVTWSMFFRKKK